MLPKPGSWGPQYGATFSEQSVVDAYPYRPPYPEEVFDVLAGLVVDAPRAVLDVGCGMGDIARLLAPRADRLDAVDRSLLMIERGKRLPGGDAPTLTWTHGMVETAPLAPPYALITAGESLHWLTWEAVFPRFVQVLTPRGVLAIIDRNWDHSAAVRERLHPIFQQVSTDRDYRPYNLLDELTRRGLFQQLGEQRTRPEPWRPSVDEYLACRHSQQSFSRERMGQAQAAAFDVAVRAALEELQQAGELEMHDGRLDLTVEAAIVWGTPRYPYA